MATPAILNASQPLALHPSANAGPEGSDSESDAELVSHIHPDLLLHHQNQLTMQQQAQGAVEEGGTATAEGGAAPESACLWSGCGKLFGRLEELVTHIHKEHVGTSKSTYKCMWEGCQLFGVTRTSRFALIGHIRSHTGERPFTCKLPECDKSFTRSDALTKHMRVVHNIEPLAPQSRPAVLNGPAAASKKRKRGAKADEESDMDDDLPPGVLDSGGEDDGVDDGAGAATEDDTWNPYSGKSRRRQPRRSKGGPGATTSGLGSTQVIKTEESLGGYSAAYSREADWSEDDESDYDDLYQDVDPETGLIRGTEYTPSKAKYLIVKAKYRYALGEHERLLERLKFEIEEVKRLKDAKDEGLNELIRHQFGFSITHGPLFPANGYPLSFIPAE
ncbi:hypothetical protein CPB86DRAFT_769439 [Serendipita vermifera]|nr:hypothetical protein CPB86DRAFT_769439 [Serendipita vermifera]